MPRILICVLLGLQGCSQDAQEPGSVVQAPSELMAPGDHASFFVIGKSWHFDQARDGALSLVDMGYFAEIFKTAGGTVTDAWMRLQELGAAPIPFNSEGDSGAVLYGRRGQRHQDLAALDRELPNGDYAFNFSTPAGEIENFIVTLAGTGGATDLPAAPVISLHQDGKRVASDAIIPATDVLVSWTPFDTGRADPNGIADDLIFVMMADCHGKRAFHSGRPLNTPNPLEPGKPSASLLTYADNEVVIPGDAWLPGMQYLLDVEHARLLDTDERQGVVGMSTYAVTTHLRVRAIGEPESACPEQDAR